MNVASSRDDAENLERLAAQASTIALLVSALNNSSEDNRLATISTLLNYSATWFSQPDTPIAQQLRNADLPHALAGCIRLHRNWLSISRDVLNLLRPMFQWAEWRSHVLKALCANMQNIETVIDNMSGPDYHRYNSSIQCYAELGRLTEASVDIWMQAHHTSASHPPAADADPGSNLSCMIFEAVEKYVWSGRRTVL